MLFSTLLFFIPFMLSSHYFNQLQQFLFL